jgi:glutamyl-tRNA reductase
MDAVEHLFRVVSSLDSMVLGEAQIQGQVREAYGRAVEINGGTLTVGPVLSRLFETSLRVGARVRTETQLGAGAGSIPSAAIALARGVLGSLQGRRAVVLGAGEMSALALRCLRDEGVGRPVVLSRSEERAEEMAERLGAEAESWERLPEFLEAVDVVVSATAAPHAVLTRGCIERALASGRRNPLIILDIALPRDADPAIGELPGVHLFDLDDLSQVVMGTLERRRSEVAIAEEIVAEEVESFWGWYRGRSVVPAIRELRSRAEHLRQKELDRARAALRHLSSEDMEAIDRLTRQLLAKLLHIPTARLREAAVEGREADLLEATRYLFSLEGGQPPATE